MDAFEPEDDEGHRNTSSSRQPRQFDSDDDVHFAAAKGQQRQRTYSFRQFDSDDDDAHSKGPQLTYSSRELDSDDDVRFAPVGANAPLRRADSDEGLGFFPKKIDTDDAVDFCWPSPAIDKPPEPAASTPATSFTPLKTWSSFSSSAPGHTSATIVSRSAESSSTWATRPSQTTLSVVKMIVHAVQYTREHPQLSSQKLTDAVRARHSELCDQIDAVLLEQRDRCDKSKPSTTRPTPTSQNVADLILSTILHTQRSPEMSDEEITDEVYARNAELCDQVEAILQEQRTLYKTAKRSRSNSGGTGDTGDTGGTGGSASECGAPGTFETSTTMEKTSLDVCKLGRELQLLQRIDCVIKGARGQSLYAWDHSARYALAQVVGESWIYLCFALDKEPDEYTKTMAPNSTALEKAVHFLERLGLAGTTNAEIIRVLRECNYVKLADGLSERLSSDFPSEN